MNLKKRAVLQAVDERDDWFMSRDLVERAAEILGKRIHINSVGSYLFQLFEDGYLVRERFEYDELRHYRYKYRRRA